MHARGPTYTQRTLESVGLLFMHGMSIFCRGVFIGQWQHFRGLIGPPPSALATRECHKCLPSCFYQVWSTLMSTNEWDRRVFLLWCKKTWVTVYRVLAHTRSRSSHMTAPRPWKTDGDNTLHCSACTDGADQQSTRHCYRLILYWPKTRQVILVLPKRAHWPFLGGSLWV